MFNRFQYSTDKTSLKADREDWGEGGLGTHENSAGPIGTGEQNSAGPIGTGEQQHQISLELT